MSDTVLVRIKPYNKRRGCVLRQYTVLGMRFQERKGWYEVEKEIAELLKDYKQPPVGNTPPDLTPPVFDVMTHEAAVEMEEAEEKAKQERAKAVTPHRMKPAAGALTTADLEKKDDTPEVEVAAEVEVEKPKARSSKKGRARR